MPGPRRCAMSSCWTKKRAARIRLCLFDRRRTQRGSFGALSTRLILSSAFVAVALINFFVVMCLQILLHESPQCDGLALPPRPSLGKRTDTPCHRLRRRSHQTPFRPASHTHSEYSFRLPSRSLNAEGNPPGDRCNNFPDAKPFNLDIARTLFAPLFFSLRHHNATEPSASTTQSARPHLRRPSPFEDPSSAITAERMLRRMMENRRRSDGRTVCPDARTFGLVAAAFGRLRCRSRSSEQRGGDNPRTVTWEEGRSIGEDGRGGSEEVRHGANKIRMTPVDKLQQLLQLQLRLCHREGWPSDLRPAVGMYNRLLRRLAWRSEGFGAETRGDGDCAAEQALRWLRLMQSPLPLPDGGGGCSVCDPDPMTYAHVIRALTTHRVPIRPDHRPMVPDANNGKAHVPLETFASQLGIEMAESKTPGTTIDPESLLVEAEELLAILEEKYNSRMTEGETDVERALHQGYRYLLEGWGRYAVAGVLIDSDASASKNGVHVEGEGTLPRSNRQHAIRRAQELLCSVEAVENEAKESGRSDFAVVSSSCYSSVLLALSVSDDPSSPKASEDVLERMIRQHGVERCSGHNPQMESFFNAKDVSIAFSGCIAAHAKNNDAPKAEEVLNRMIDAYDGRIFGREFVPEVRAFGTCIAQWAKFTGMPPGSLRNGGNRKKLGNRKNEMPSHRQRLHNADRAEAILSELERIAKLEAIKGNGKFALHATPYNIAISARCQTVVSAGRASTYSDAQTVLRAQSILDRMDYEMGVAPDPYTYSILLHAWCQQSRPGNEKAADYGEELLRRRIEDVDISRVSDDNEDLGSIETSQVDIWPNVKHYSSVLKAHAKTKSAGGAKKALGLLSEMERRYFSANAINDADGNVDEYNTDQKDAAKPDLVCYSIVIDAFANSRLPEASSVAHRLLRAVEAKYEAGDYSMKPNARVYTAVILSLVHSEYVDDGLGQGDDERSECTNNAQRAWKILERMKENAVTPNSFTYNYIINCAAQAGKNAEEQRISLDIALRAFRELREANDARPDAEGRAAAPCHPDSFTFAFMLKAFKNLIPPGALRAKAMSEMFEECRQSGYLNDAVLTRLWHGVSKEKFCELVKDDKAVLSASRRSDKPPVRAQDLPVSWCRCCSRSTGKPKSGNKPWNKGIRLDVS